MASIISTDFEEYVWANWWLRNFPTPYWSRSRAKRLVGRFTVDFTACRANERAVGDAKDKACITFNDVEKLIDDGGIYKARWLYLLIAADTRIPVSVWRHANENGVIIVRTRWRAEG